MPDLDTSNRFMVSARRDRLVIMMPPVGPLTRVEAYVLAAWLVSMAEVLPGEEKFEDVLARVQGS